VLERALSSHVNFVNALQLAAQRGVAVSESHAGGPAAVEGIRVDFETSAGVTSVSGAVVLGRARLLEVNGIRVEVPLAGRLIYMSNFDVPGVIGHVGSVLGKNDVNIANFSLGREERTSASGEALRAVAVVEVDSIIEEKVLNELRSHAAVRFVSVVEL
jgi:D-3-phosphoglycerate dehydrogenase